MTLKFEGLPAGEAFRIYDDSGSGTKLIAIVRWDDLSKALGLDFSQISVAEMDAFKAADPSMMPDCPPELK